MFLISFPIVIVVVLVAIAILYLIFKNFSPPISNPSPGFLVKIELNTASSGHTNGPNGYFIVDYKIKDLIGNPINGYTANFTLTNTGPYNPNDNIGEVIITSSPGSGPNGQLQIEIPNPFKPRDPNNTYPTPKLPKGGIYTVDVIHNYGALANVTDPPPRDVVEPRDP